MKIPSTCERCDKTYNVPEKHAGRRVKCPACGGPIPVAMEAGEIRRPGAGKAKKAPAAKAKARPGRTGRKPKRSKAVYLLVFLVLAAAGAAVYYFYLAPMKAPPPVADSGPDPLAYIPATCTAYGGVNLQKIFAAAQESGEDLALAEAQFEEKMTPLLTADVGDHAGAAALQKELLEKGPMAAARARLKRLVVGIDPSRAKQARETDAFPGLIVIETRRPAEPDVEAMAVLSGEEVRRGKIGGGIPTFESPKAGEKAVAALLAPTLVAVGDRKLITDAAAIDGGGGRAITAETDLMALSAGERDNLLWIAWKVGEAEREMLKADAPPTLPFNPDDLRAVLLLIDYGPSDGMVVSVKARMATPAAAEATKNGLLGMVKPMAMMFLGLEDGDIRGETDGSNVKLTVVFTQEKLKALQEQGKAMAMPRPGTSS